MDQRICFSSAQFSRSVVSDSLQPHGLQHTRPPYPLPTPGAYSNWSPLNWWCHPTISSSILPFSCLLQSFPALGSFPITSHQLFKVLEFQLQHQSFQWIFRTDLLYDGLVGFPCCPRDSQESSPKPQFKSINSSSYIILNIKNIWGLILSLHYLYKLIWPDLLKIFVSLFLKILLEYSNL